MNIRVSASAKRRLIGQARARIRRYEDKQLHKELTAEQFNKLQDLIAKEREAIIILTKD